MKKISILSILPLLFIIGCSEADYAYKNLIPADSIFTVIAQNPQEFLINIDKIFAKNSLLTPGSKSVISSFLENLKLKQEDILDVIALNKAIIFTYSPHQSQLLVSIKDIDKFNSLMTKLGAPQDFIKIKGPANGYYSLSNRDITDFPTKKPLDLEILSNNTKNNQIGIYLNVNSLKDAQSLAALQQDLGLYNDFTQYLNILDSTNEVEWLKYTLGFDDKLINIEVEAKAGVGKTFTTFANIQTKSYAQTQRFAPDNFLEMDFANSTMTYNKEILEPLKTYLKEKTAIDYSIFDPISQNINSLQDISKGNLHLDIEVESNNFIPKFGLVVDRAYSSNENAMDLYAKTGKDIRTLVDNFNAKSSNNAANPFNFQNLGPEMIKGFSFNKASISLVQSSENEFLTYTGLANDKVYFSFGQLAKERLENTLNNEKATSVFDSDLGKLARETLGPDQSLIARVNLNQLLNKYGLATKEKAANKSDLGLVIGVQFDQKHIVVKMIAGTDETFGIVKIFTDMLSQYSSKIDSELNLEDLQGLKDLKYDSELNSEFESDLDKELKQLNDE